MFKQIIRFRIITIVLAGLLVISLTGGPVQAAEKKNDSKGAPALMTQAELQAQVMAFADRYTSIMVAAFQAYAAQAPAPENYKRLLSVCTYSLSSAVTIAAEPNPVGALLDMVAMVTLGRIIFEDHWVQEFGPQVQPIAEGLRKAERDIREVSAKVLSPEQQNELEDILIEWRKNNPEVLFFPSIRFSEFSASRTGLEKGKASGLFKSVEKITQQVDEVRLLAERGIFLSTRMPMLTGLFAGVWFSQMTEHPDVEKILKDLDTFSKVSERLAVVAEQLPDRIAIERDATIKQAMENISRLTMATMDETAKKVSLEREAAIRQLLVGFSAERKKTIEDFLNEDQRLRGLLSELRLTLAEGNKLITSTDSLIKGLELKPSEAKPEAPAKPLDIKQYQATLKEASNTITELHGLVKTIDQMQALPQIAKAFDTVEKRGEKLIFFLFILSIALILFFLAGSVIALLAYRRLSDRISGPARQQAGS